MATLHWTIDEAHTLRRRMEAHYARRQRLIAFWAQGPVVAALGAAAAIGGPDVYLSALRRVARQMNRHQGDAFADYTPQAGDVVVSAYFKAGTNWVMQICHQIAHLGTGDFDHIQDVIPWPDAAQPRYWIDIRDPEPRNSPTGYRVIKSHLAADAVPLVDAARYIAVTRDPKDCAASAYHYFRTLVMGPTTPPPDVWLDFFGSDEAIFGRWDAFTASWHALRDRPNVLFLRYEKIREDPAATVTAIARFLGLTLTDEQTSRVLDRISFAEMKKLNARFYPVRQSLWSEADGQIIRKGAVGDNTALFSAEARQRLDRGMRDGLAQRHSTFAYADHYLGTAR